MSQWWVLALQARHPSQRHSEAGAEAASDDGDGVEEHRCPAVARLDSLHGARSRYGPRDTRVDV